MNFLKKNHENKINNKIDLSKSLKLITIVILSIVTFSCSSDDDSSSDRGDTLTTAQLLRSGTWYLESKTPNDFTECEKNSSFKFNTDNTVDVESFAENADVCESDGVINTNYSLNGNDLTIAFGSDSIEATINSISETTLTITDDEGDTIVFDKTQG